MGCCCSSPNGEKETKSSVFFIDSGGKKTGIDVLKVMDKKPIMLVPGVGGTRLIAKICREQTPHKKHSKPFREILAWPNLVRPSGALENFLIGRYNSETREYVSMSEAISPIPGAYPGHTVAKISPVQGSTGLEGCDSLLGTSYPDFIREYAGYFIRLQEHFEKNWDYKKGVDLFAFGFDWRLAPTCAGFMRKMHKSVRKAYCAANGITLEEEEKEKDKKIDGGTRKKLALIGHSYGGVIAKFYLITHSKQYLKANLPNGSKLTQKMMWYKYVNKFIAIGTPFDGAGGILTASPFCGYTFGMSPLFFNSITSSTIEHTVPAFPFLLPNMYFRFGVQPDIFIKVMKKSTGDNRASTSLIRMSENLDYDEEEDEEDEYDGEYCVRRKRIDIDDVYGRNKSIYFSCDDEYYSDRDDKAPQSKEKSINDSEYENEDDTEVNDEQSEEHVLNEAIEPDENNFYQESNDYKLENNTQNSNVGGDNERRKSATTQDSESDVELSAERKSKKKEINESNNDEKDDIEINFDGETNIFVKKEESKKINPKNSKNIVVDISTQSAPLHSSNSKSDEFKIKSLTTPKNRRSKGKEHNSKEKREDSILLSQTQFSSSGLSSGKIKKYGLSTDTVPMLGKILYSFGLHCQGLDGCLEGGIIEPPSDEMLSELKAYLPKTRSIKAKIPFITKNLLLSHFGKKWRKRCYNKNKVTEYEGNGKWIRFTVLPEYLSTDSNVDGSSDYKRTIKAIVDHDNIAVEKGLRKDSDERSLLKRYSLSDAPKGLLAQIEINKGKMNNNLLEVLTNLNNYQAGFSPSPLGSPSKKKKKTPKFESQEVTMEELNSLETRCIFDLYSKIVPPCPVLQYVCYDKHTVDAFEHSCELLPIDPKIVFNEIPNDDFKYVSIVGNSIPTKYHVVINTPVEELCEIFDAPASFVMCEGDGTVPIVSSLADGFPEKYVGGRFVVTNCGHFELMMNNYTYRIIEKLLGLRSF